jgi:hypothetical protein
MIGSAWRMRARGSTLQTASLEAAAGREGVEAAVLAAGPGPEGDLVDRHVEGDLVGLPGDHLGHRPGPGGEAVHELGAEEVEPLRPAVVAEVPDHLDAGVAGGAHPRQEAGEVEPPRGGDRAVPGDPLADRADAEREEAPVIGRRPALVPGRGGKVEATAIPPFLAGALETCHPEGLERPLLHAARGCKRRTNPPVPPRRRGRREEDDFPRKGAVARLQTLHGSPGGDGPPTLSAGEGVSPPRTGWNSVVPICPPCGNF